MKKSQMVLVALCIIFLVAAFLRVDFLRSVYHHMSHDSKNYDAMVRQIIEDGVYAYKNTEPNARVAPGYPMFLTAVYNLVDYTERDPLTYVRYLQVLMSLVSLWLIYHLTRKFAGTGTGLVAAAIGAIYPPFIWANGAVLTEVLATFFLLVYVVWQLHTFEVKSRWHALISGLWLGLTVLTRPEFLPIMFALYAFYWLWKKEWITWKLLTYSLAGLVIVMLPWWIRNLVTLHEMVLLATQTNPFTAGTYPYKNYLDGLVDRHGKTQNEVAIERLKIGFTEHTWLFIKWYTVGKLQYVYWHMFFGGGHKPMYTVFPFRGAYHQLIILFGIVGAAATLIRWKQMLTALTVIIVIMSGIRLVFVPEYRYNFSMMPLIIILDCVVAAAMIKWLWSKVNGRGKQA